MKKNVGNKARVERSICNAYLVEEASKFCSHYFELYVNTRQRNVPHNDDGGVVVPIEGNLSIFTDALMEQQSLGQLKARNFKPLKPIFF